VPVVVVLTGVVCLLCAVSGAKQFVWFDHTVDIRQQQLHLHPTNWRQDPRSIGSDFVDSCLVCAYRLASVGCSVGILLRPLRGHMGTLLWLYHKLIRS
jgi:hypothetical protein